MPQGQGQEREMKKDWTMDSGTWGEVLVPAVESRSEGGEDGASRLCSPFIFPVRESHMQTEQATSATLVYLSALLSQALRGYKSPCLCEPCSKPLASVLSSISIPRSAHHTFRSAPEPCLCKKKMQKYNWQRVHTGTNYMIIPICLH